MHCLCAANEIIPLFASARPTYMCVHTYVFSSLLDDERTPVLQRTKGLLKGFLVKKIFVKSGRSRHVRRVIPPEEERAADCRRLQDS